MSQPYGNQLYDQFLSLQTAAADERVFSLAPPHLLDFAISGYEYDSSSGCSSYVHSPTSNSTTYGAQSPTLLNTNLEGYHKYNNIHMKSESSYGIAESTQGVQEYKWELASERSIFESMNRATPYTPEEKKERIQRYRSKRILRNFTKKIKYECRKTLADSRPRVRGRFARNDEIEKASQRQFQEEEEEEEEEEEYDYSWITILDALNKSDALISSF